MKSARIPTAVAAAAAIALVAVVIVNSTVHAQSTQPGPVAMPPADHMMHDHSAAGGEHTPAQGTPTQGSHPTMPEEANDPREVVPLPGPMQEHMLANMRDHLATLNAVVGDIADDKFDAARKLLEERLGMSSLPLHHAAEMAPYFPQPMQDAGTSMHRAASRLAIALQDASVDQTFDAMRQVNAALHEVTSACVACHAGYRLR
jgi:hypothetical protein